MSDDPFDRIMGDLDAPMIVVTTAAGGERAGCLVGFHSQSSIHPGRYAVWLSRANHTFRVAQYATHLGVHFLAATDRRLAEDFGTRSGDDVDKFIGRDLTVGAGDVPLLDECANRMLARKIAMLDDGGDHVVVVTEPVEVDVPTPFRPLMRSQLADLPAGHPADDHEEHP